ncbi:MAG: hypothetical protein ACK4NA_07070 [Alphaproteobacteria bacterium]
MKEHLLLRARSGCRRTYACILQGRFSFERLQLGKDLVGIHGKQPFDVHSEHLDPVAKRAVKTRS